jgi:hypothetical protein
VDLRLQVPGSSSGYLLEVLLDEARGAERGGAMFSFASVDGVRALLSDDAFRGLLEVGSFDLVVGIDAITDERAVAALSHFAEEHEGLAIRIFLHDQPVLFHPKLAWFRHGETVTLVVGSGNLTVRGLRENWEGFAVTRVTGAAATAVEEQLSDWRLAHARYLLPPEDRRVAERASRNTGRESDLRHPRTSVTTASLLPDEAAVLVAETPLSGGRVSQVNFDKANYEGFFGAAAGTGRRVILRAVAADGTIGEEEVPPSSSRPSQNYSLELAAFRATPPRTPPVMGVYVRLPQGSFLYQRVAPGEDGYDALAGFLDEQWVGRTDRMRRVPASVSDVRGAWPDSPLWSVELPSS